MHQGSTVVRVQQNIPAAGSVSLGWTGSGVAAALPAATCPANLATLCGVTPFSWGYSLWAGHVARFSPDRLCKQVLVWRNLDWWRRRQSLISLGLGGLLHPEGCSGRPGRREEKVVACTEWISDIDSGPTDWVGHAQNRYLWKRDIIIFSNFDL